MSMNPFEFLNSINYNKNDMMANQEEQEIESQYPSFLINRSLSYFPDTVAVANEMNRYHHTDNKLQYHFLLNIVRKRKRFSKWMKADEFSDIEVVKKYYGYSNSKAKQALSLLSPDQIIIIRQKVDQGGRK